MTRRPRRRSCTCSGGMVRKHTPASHPESGPRIANTHASCDDTLRVVGTYLKSHSSRARRQSAEKRDWGSLALIGQRRAGSVDSGGYQHLKSE